MKPFTRPVLPCLTRLFRLGAAAVLFLFVLMSRTPAALAKTYVITGGAHSLTYTTAASADSLEALDSPVIQRPLELRLSYRGTVRTVTSPGETVEALLERLGLDLTEQDILSHPLDAPLEDGMTLTVESHLTRREVYTAAIPHETLRYADASLPEGVEEVLIPGQDGELLYTALVTYRNGRETGRELLSESQTIAPVTEVIAQGTGAAVQAEEQEMPIIFDGYIQMPSGEILTYYKTDNVTATGYTHTDPGCDLITATGTTVHYGTAAVDPRFIPYGTRMLIVSHDGERYYGIATAEDCGGAIKRDKMDLYFPTHQDCIEFGRRRCTIYFLG